MWICALPSVLVQGNDRTVPDVRSAASKDAALLLCLEESEESDHFQAETDRQTKSFHFCKKKLDFKTPDAYNVFCQSARGREPQRLMDAEVAQLVEHHLAMVGVASSSLVFRSNMRK